MVYIWDRDLGQNFCIDGSDFEVDQIEFLAEQWAKDLQRWALPSEITNQSPVSNFRLDPSRFAPGDALVGDIRTRLVEEVAQRLKGGEKRGAGLSLIDVGAGAGSSLSGIHQSFAQVVALEANSHMVSALEENLANLREEGSFQVHEGTFPDDFSHLPSADVVNASNVVYNVGDIMGFLRSLDRLADHLVVIEATLRHPFYPSNPAFYKFWALDRPSTPTGADLLEICRTLGFPVELQAYPPQYSRGGMSAEGLRTRLGLPESRSREVEDYLATEEQPLNPSVLLWWEK